MGAVRAEWGHKRNDWNLAREAADAEKERMVPSRASD